MTARAVTLIGVDGTRHELMAAPGGPYDLRTSAQLWGLAPTAVTSRPVGTIPGERIEAVRATPRTFAVPILVKSVSELELDERLGALGLILSPRSDVRIVYTRPDGVAREITARYVGGGEAITVEHEEQRFVRVPLVFRAFWPYWRAVTADVSISGPTAFDDGFFGGSNDITLSNTGDADTWPEFTINGHAESIEAVHLGTGRVLRVTEVIATGDVLRIDTDPRSFGVWINDVSAQTALDPVSQLFPLRPGSNRIILRANSDLGVSPIGDFTIRWQQHYETP